jgi:hypothetical protein
MMEQIPVESEEKTTVVEKLPQDTHTHTHTPSRCWWGWLHTNKFLMGVLADQLQEVVSPNSIRLFGTHCTRTQVFL